MSILMKNSSNDKEKISSLINECKTMGITVTQPSINKSDIDFDPYINDDQKKCISYGLGTIKNISSNGMKSLVEERKKNNEFKSIEDFISRMSKSPLSKGALEPLIKVGAFDEIDKRERLLPSVEKIAQELTRRHKLEVSGQANMFDLFGDEVKVPLNLQLSNVDIDYKERMFWERDLLGTVLSENPINKKIETFSKSHIVLYGQLNPNKSNERVSVIGQVISITTRSTRSKDSFIICELGLLDSSIELIVWPDKMESSQDLWETGSYLELGVKTNIRNGSLNLIYESGKKLEFENNDLEKFTASSIESQEDTGEKNIQEIKTGNDQLYSENQLTPVNDNDISKQAETYRINFLGSKNLIEDKYKFDDIMKLLLEHENKQGGTSIEIKILYDDNSMTLDLPISVNISEELVSKLDNIMGRNNIIIT
jgi:DNA polymerase-3 subunit alpha